MSAITYSELVKQAELLDTDEQLKLAVHLLERLRQTNKLAAEETEAPVSILSLAGVGADLWRQIDVDRYLDEERDSWDR